MPSNHIDLLFFSCMFLFSKPLHFSDFDSDLEGEQPLSKWV